MSNFTIVPEGLRTGSLSRKQQRSKPAAMAGVELTRFLRDCCSGIRVKDSELLLQLFFAAAVESKQHLEILEKRFRPPAQSVGQLDGGSGCSRSFADRLLSIPTVGRLQVYGRQCMVANYSVLSTREVGTDNETLSSSVQTRRTSTAEVKTTTRNVLETTKYEIQKLNYRHLLEDQRVVSLSEYRGGFPNRIRKLVDDLRSNSTLRCLFHVVTANKFKRLEDVTTHGTFLSRRTFQTVSSIVRHIPRPRRRRLDPVLTFANSVVVTGWLPEDVD